MTATPRQLDHGMLNIPLSKRGDIDAQIDRYKASQSRQAKARNKATLAAQRAAIAEAKAAIAAVSDARMAEIGAARPDRQSHPRPVPQRRVEPPGCGDCRHEARGRQRTPRQINREGFLKPTARLSFPIWKS